MLNLNPNGALRSTTSLSLNPEPQNEFPQADLPFESFCFSKKFPPIHFHSILRVQHLVHFTNLLMFFGERILVAAQSQTPREGNFQWWAFRFVCHVSSVQFGRVSSGQFRSYQLFSRLWAEGLVQVSIRMKGLN